MAGVGTPGGLSPLGVSRGGVGADPEAIARKAKSEDPEALRGAAREFESLFLHQLFKSMRQTVLQDEEGLLNAGMGGEMFTDMLDMEYAKQSAEQGGIGLAAIVAQQFGVEMQDASDPAGSDAGARSSSEARRPHGINAGASRGLWAQHAARTYASHNDTHDLHMPVEGGRVSSRFGMRKLADDVEARMHQGLDIAAAEGTPIEAARAGKVVHSGWIRGYGNAVILDHGEGQTTLYGHASALLVEVGDQVAAGTPIAKVGSTGHSTGPHLHFEVRKHGRAQDPSGALGLDPKRETFR